MSTPPQRKNAENIKYYAFIILIVICKSSRYIFRKQFRYLSKAFEETKATVREREKEKARERENEREYL